MFELNNSEEFISNIVEQIKKAKTSPINNNRIKAIKVTKDFRNDNLSINFKANSIIIQVKNELRNGIVFFVNVPYYST